MIGRKNLLAIDKTICLDLFTDYQMVRETWKINLVTLWFNMSYMFIYFDFQSSVLKTKRQHWHANRLKWESNIIPIWCLLILVLWCFIQLSSINLSELTTPSIIWRFFRLLSHCVDETESISGQTTRFFLTCSSFCSVQWHILSHVCSRWITEHGSPSYDSLLTQPSTLELDICGVVFTYSENRMFIPVVVQSLSDYVVFSIAIAQICQLTCKFGCKYCITSFPEPAPCIILRERSMKESNDWVALSVYQRFHLSTRPPSWPVDLRARLKLFLRSESSRNLKQLI